MSEAPADVRLILLGSQRFGVTSVANRILGGAEEFEWEMRNTRSVVQRAEVGGTRVQLVKAPVWFRSYHLQDTAELVKQNLVLSVTHCPPGPHAFILLCEVDLPFTRACVNAVTAHLGLFGENVWKHTLLLFTCADWLGNTSLEEYMKGEGPHLAALMDRCGHRYVMDHTGAPDLSHRLLQKVQELLATNGGAHFNIPQDTIQRTLQSREEVTRRAELRRQRREKRTRTKPGGFISNMTIVLLGWVFAAKTLVYSALCPSQLPQVGQRTEECVISTRTETVGTSTVSLQVVDIPGWWKFFKACLVPAGVRAEINKALKKAEASHKHPYSETAFLLMLPADTSFTHEQLTILTSNVKPLEDSVWDRTILVFTGGQWIQNFDIEQHIESEEALVCLVERCANRYFVFDTEAEQSRMEAQGDQLIKMVLDMAQSSPKKTKPGKYKRHKQEKNTAQVQTPVQAPVQAPVKAPVQTPVQAPVQAPVQTPVQAPVQAPVQTPVQTPVQAPVPTPVQAPVQTPLQAPVKAPVQTPVQAPVQAPTQAPVQTPVQTPVQAPVQTPVQTPVQAPVQSEAGSEEAVDVDLKKMVEVLHQVWAWGEWEIQEIKSRLDHRPIEKRDDWSMPQAMGRRSWEFFINFNSGKVEDIVRDETEGKTLEELLHIVSKIYNRRECGAFDIVSIICENEQFKPEWRSLFEREWARREACLLEYTYNKYFKFNASDVMQWQKERLDYVQAWMRSLEHGPEWTEDLDSSIKEPVENIMGKVIPVRLKRTPAPPGGCSLNTQMQVTVGQ